MLELDQAPAFTTTLPQGRGLAVTSIADLGIAGLLPQQGRQAGVAAAIEAALGLKLDDRPVRTTSGSFSALGIGPGKWLVTADGAGNRLARRLMEIVGDAAAVEDQSDGYAVLRLVGPGCGPVLARGVNIDLHPSQFAVGAVAVTSIAHVGVILWRREDTVEGPAFELAAFRSMAGSLLHWLEAAIAGAGLRLG